MRENIYRFATIKIIIEFNLYYSQLVNLLIEGFTDHLTLYNAVKRKDHFYNDNIRLYQHFRPNKILTN